MTDEPIVRISLGDQVVGNGEAFHAEQTWAGMSGEKMQMLVLYAERRVRDWRWLWLRRKTVHEIVGSAQLR